MSYLILVSRLQSWSNIEIEVYGQKTKIFNMNVQQNSAISTSGYCDILNNHLIAVFSKGNKNFLSLQNNLVELTSAIEIKYHVAQFANKESWFKIYNKSDLIFEITYINPHKPFILPDPFAYDEDYNTTNFANHLAGYIGQVRENPDIILFPLFGTGCT